MVNHKFFCVLLFKKILLCKMTNQESFTTSETVSIVPSITQNASILNRDNKQDVSLTTGLTVPHTSTVQYLTVTAQTLQPPNRGELGDLLSKDQILDNPPNQDNREFPPPIVGGGPGPNPGQSTQSGQQGVPPSNCRRGTMSQSRTIHSIRTTGRNGSKAKTLLFRKRKNQP